MNWIASLFIASLSAIAGLFSAGFVANAYAGWNLVSNREGAAGYLVILSALLGGLVGFVHGLVVSRFVAASTVPKPGKALVLALLPILLVAGVVWLSGYLRAGRPSLRSAVVLAHEWHGESPAPPALPDPQGSTAPHPATGERGNPPSRECSRTVSRESLLFDAAPSARCVKT